MFNFDPQNPEISDSSVEQSSSSPDQDREKLQSQQKIETDQLNREHAKGKSETVQNAASDRADLMASMPTPPAPESTPSTTPLPPEVQKILPASIPAGAKLTEFIDKFKSVFDSFSQKFNDFFINLFGKKNPNATTSNLDNSQVQQAPQPAPAPSTPAQPETKIEGPDDTAGLKGEALLNNQNFRNRTSQIAQKIGCSTEDLFAIFKMESGADPQAVNKISKATGLIQWMPKYAPQFGTTTTELGKMTGLQQLEYVEKFFAPHFGKLHTFSDLYRAVFWPAAIGKGPDYIFQTSSQSAELIAQQNPGIAKVAGRPDGYIDNAGFEKYANKFAPKISIS